MGKKVVVLQSNYIPWKGYFDLINDADVFCFYDEVKYTKNDWRNRNKIHSKNGLHWLSIPIDKNAVKLKISEVKFRDHLWQEQHFNTLWLSYKKAPFFNQLEPFLLDFYKNKNWESLSEFNQYSIEKISDFIGISTIFVNSLDYDLKKDRVNRLITLVMDLGATEYISGPSAKVYLKDFEYLFESNNIKISYKNYDDYPSYKQLSEPFENYVSIVDLLANIHQDQIQDYIWKRNK